MTRTLGMACAILATSFVLGCSSDHAGSGSGTQSDAQTGKVGLPLSATASSGTEYRLRNATFEMYGWPDECDDEDCEPYENSVSSEDYLDQPSITLDLLKGSYDIFLSDGWELEQIVDGEAEVVEAQLLSNSYQYVYVRPYQTTWVNFEFGVGDKKLWFTGQVQINMDVFEDPEDYYAGDCYTYGDGDTCWRQCCKEYCDGEDCWGECWEDEVPCEDNTGGAGGSPSTGGRGGGPSTGGRGAGTGGVAGVLAK